MKSLLKRNGIEAPKGAKTWSKLYRAWLLGLVSDASRGSGMRAALGSSLRQLENMEVETNTLEEAVGQLAQTDRYKSGVEALCIDQGVGVLTAMVFLTELGDARRFNNRQQIAAYFGLAPTSNSSGESDRKGHITRHGSGRMRAMLCQAMWARLRCDSEEKERYERLASKNPKHKKIAVVAGMRRLVIRMWHHACDAGNGTTAERLAQRQTKRLGSGSTEGGPPLAPSSRRQPPIAARGRGDGEGGRGSRKPAQKMH